jgi:hypothetical protein
MTMATKNEIFREFFEEYINADRGRKGEILDHITKTTKMWRESVIRRFKRMQFFEPHSKKKPGRKVYYTKDVDDALYDIWEAGNRACGELLCSIIGEYVSILQRDKMWRHGDEATGKLLSMAKRTVRRRIEKLREKYGDSLRGRSSTKPSHLKSIIPIFKGPWDDLPPGHGQIDTVAHCDDSLSGDFIYTVNYTDTALYWIRPRAQWNKGGEATKESLESIRKKLPMSLLHLHPDTGSEFITWNLKRWCQQEKIEFTRSEPNKKNDNMYVEERNGHVIRKYLGYTRLDCHNLVPLVNELYDVLALYLNHFMPVRRTLKKERIGSKYHRVFEKCARTPYTRALEHPDVLESVKETLKHEHESLNPLVLKQKIDKIIEKIKKKQRNYKDQN